MERLSVAMAHIDKLHLNQFDLHLLIVAELTEGDIMEAVNAIKATDAIYVSFIFQKQDEEKRFPKTLNRFLKQLAKAIENNEQIQSFKANLEQPASFYNLRQLKAFLTPGLLKKMLTRLEYSNFIEKPTDFNLFLSNEMVSNHLLASKECREVLSQYYDSKQLYIYSCAAHSIMKFLFASGKIDKLSLLSELEIYSQIWLERGGRADPKKIKEYLEAQGIEVSLIEDEQLVAPLLHAQPNLKTSYNYLHSVFVKKHQGFNDISFQPNSAMLLIVQGGLHIVMALRTADGEITLYSTDNTMQRSFKTIEAFKLAHLELANALPLPIKPPSLSGFTGLAMHLFFKPAELKSVLETKSSPRSFRVFQDSEELKSGKSLEDGVGWRC